MTLVKYNLLYLLVVIRAPEVVEDATFIRLKVASQSAFSTRKSSKIEINNVSLNLFIKSEGHVIFLNPKIRVF
jgi:hypothetical protein